MPVRQHHKKSRRGCLRCKTRHVKCDEQGPPCANCRVRNIDCSYGTVVDAAMGVHESVPEEEIFTPAKDRRLELELLHQWSVETYRSLAVGGGNEHLWQVVIPRTALDHEYLLDSIFALTALHVSITSTTSTSESIKYQMSALKYHTQAVMAFQSEDRSANIETHQAIFAFSIINFTLTVALPSCLDRSIEKSRIFDNFATMFSHLQGTTRIHHVSRNWLADGPFAYYLQAYYSIPVERLDKCRNAAFEKLRAIRDEEYGAWMSMESSALDAVRMHESMSHTIDTLEGCFRLESNDKMVLCFRWLALLEEDFVLRIQNLEPLSLLITMYWAILLDRLSRDKWWAKSAGKALVAEISRLLVPRRPDWCSFISSIHLEVGLPPLVPKQLANGHSSP